MGETLVQALLVVRSLWALVTHAEMSDGLLFCCCSASTPPPLFLPPFFLHPFCLKPAWACETN